MEDRYELRGKIGQGGLGAVYRAYDTKMSRIVAIKRITPGASDTEHVEESTKQLVKEAGALARLQHPNIVTIHDVGSDSDGPFVVMELIEGKTLDEAIDHAPLTWRDFQELAMQVMEALIAAQEHNLIHSDLKPANLMVTWLPSGKFQIKIVDFGLASLALSQKKEDLKSINTVYGSIFFMPPEQFERQPLDLRSDMYSIGCVFYQALAGRYPFNGETTQEVMNAHLNHTVPPLKEVRAGIPMWVSDWVMWHLNRNPGDRPASAREALSNFLQNNKFQGHPLTTGMPEPVAGPPRRRMRLPGETSSHEPLPHETATHLVSAPEPVPLRPPEGLKPSLHTHTVAVRLPEPASRPLSSISDIPTGPVPTRAIPTRRTATIAKGAPHSTVAVKTNKNIIPIAAACVSLIVIGGIVMKLNGAYSGKRMAADLITQVEANGGSDIPVTQKSLANLLDFLSTGEGAQLAPRLCPALAKVKASDSTDVDLKVAELVAGESSIPLRTRDLLITETLGPRTNPSILPAMIKIIEAGKDKELVASSLVAVRPMLGDEHLDPMLKVLCDTSDPHAQSSAETNITEILRKSKTPAVLVDKLKSAKGTAVKQDVIQSLKRLITTGEGMAPGGSDLQRPTPPTGTGTTTAFKPDHSTIVLSATAQPGNQTQDFSLAVPATGRYVAFETLSSDKGQPFVHVSELVLMAPGNSPIPSSRWNVIWSDSEESKMDDGRATNLIDGNPASFWHSRYSSQTTPNPHFVVIDLGERKTISAVRIINRKGSAYGSVEKFRIHVSDNEFPKQ